MAYIGYDTRIAPKARALPRPKARPATRQGPRIAWVRLTIIAANVVAWVGIIAAVRAIF